jgi:hypothetical protein
MPSIISPYPMRSTVSDEAGSLRISIPMRRKPLLFLFFLVWLGGWTVGGIDTGRQLLQRFNPFLAFWMCGWVVGETMVTYALLRMAGGQDVIRIDQGLIEVRKDVFGWGLSRRYSLSEVRGLRFQSGSGSGRGHRESTIAFDYGTKTIAFGEGVDEAEATKLIRVIGERCKLPQTMPSETRSIRFWQSG